MSLVVRLLSGSLGCCVGAAQGSGHGVAQLGKQAMQPRLTRGEYWLLETVVDGAWPLCFVARTNAEEVFNKPGHGLERAALIETLESLFASGLLEAHRHGQAAAMPLARTEIIAALEEPSHARGAPGTLYRLTAQGGAVWEAFAMPDWKAYLLRELDEDQGVGAFTALDRQWLQEDLEHFSVYEHAVARDSVQWERLGRWQPTYWKELPEGYRVRFRFGPTPSGEEPSPLDGFGCGYGRCAQRESWYRWR